jgi:hypothetical protein
MTEQAGRLFFCRIGPLSPEKQRVPGNTAAEMMVSAWWRFGNP